MKKPYLISVSSYTPGVNRYLDTAKNLKGSVDMVFVDCEPYTDRNVINTVGPDTCRVYGHRGHYPGHHHRWGLIPEDLDQSRWWIFTDVHDVIFQGPIPDLDQFNADILLQYEGMNHRNNGFWNQYIDQRYRQELADLLPLPVYNCGVVAARGYLMNDYRRYITSYPPEMWDQLPFNKWVSGYSRAKNCPELSASIYDNYYQGKLIFDYDRRLFVWKDTGVVPAIVHGNGSSKEVFTEHGL